jgi:hypothetical protein
MPIRGIVAVILLLLLLYGGFKAAPLLLGPRIDLTSPLPDEVFADGRVLVAGIARNTENLTLDGAPLLIDRNGFFSTTLVLPPGGAILVVSVTDRFGRSHTLERSVYVPN